MPECPFHRALGQGAVEPAGLDHVVDVVLDAGDRDQGGDLPGAVGLGRPGARRAADTGRLGPDASNAGAVSIVMASA